jgi:hypothetical protein
MMFSAFGLPDMAQVNVSVDIHRFQEMYRYIDHVNEEEALHPEYGYSEHLLRLALRLRYLRKYLKLRCLPVRLGLLLATFFLDLPLAL